MAKDKTLTQMKKNIDTLQNDNDYLKSRNRKLSGDVRRVVNVFETFIKIFAFIASVVVTVYMFIGLYHLYELDAKHPFGVIVLCGILFLAVLFLVNLLVWSIANALLVNKIKLCGTDRDC